MCIDWPNVIAGGAISAVVSLGVAWLFYWLATKDLRAEAGSCDT